MTVILKNTQPLLREVTRLSPKAVQVYLVLWQSAQMDVRYDKRVNLPWHQRRDCGGTTEWTVKGIADHIGSKRDTVRKALSQLLDDGLISVAGYSPSPYGTKHTVFRLTHPDELDNVRHSIALIVKPSVRWQQNLTAKRCDYDPYSISDDGCSFLVF